MTGSVGQKRVPADFLNHVLLPLPPLAEQRRIVAKVEALLAGVHAGRQRLAKVPAILKRFRQSVLVAAFSGRLTLDWREAQSEGETGQTLLARIRVERQKAVITGKRRARSETIEDEDATSSALGVRWDTPASWVWAHIHELLSYDRSAAYGVLQPGGDTPGGVPFVRVCDLGKGTVDASGVKRIDPAIDRQYPRTRLHGDEVLVTLVGTIGRTAVAPKHLAGANVARAIGMLPLCPHVLPRFLVHALDEPTKNRELVDLAREVARKTLNLGLLKAVEVPLPPRAEQEEIIRRVEGLFRLADAIEKRIAAATARAEKLTQAVLAKAFRGELVPTEADLALRESRSYEPASVLLERIRARPPSRLAARKRLARSRGA
jgi:type I restriction enzyme S subunit